MITRELYELCVDYLAWYDDVVSFWDYAHYLTERDIKMAKLAEEIINLWLKGM